MFAIPHERSRLVRRVAAVAAGFVLACAMQVHATVFQWLATGGPDAGASGSANVVIGAPQANPSFGIASFNVTAAVFCGVCTPLTLDLSGAHFDAATSGLLGTITGSFLGQGGNTHTFSLTLGDVVGGEGTFSFSNTTVGDGTVVDSGIYSPVVDPVASATLVGDGTVVDSGIDSPVVDPVASATLVPAAPEPATLTLLGIGLVGLGFSRRQRKR